MKTQIGIVCLAAGAFALLSGIAQAQDRDRMTQDQDHDRMSQARYHRTMSRSDRTFMREAAQGGIAEVKLGELAARQGERESVREFGQKMVDDHSKADDALNQIAQNKGITLPTEMDSDSRALYRRLSHLHGAAFDRAYIRAMRDDHSKDITAFRNEAHNGLDADVRDFASKTLDTVRHHYDMASDIANSPHFWR